MSQLRILKSAARVLAFTALSAAFMLTFFSFQASAVGVPTPQGQVKPKLDHGDDETGKKKKGGSGVETLSPEAIAKNYLIDMRAEAQKKPSVNGRAQEVSNIDRALRLSASGWIALVGKPNTGLTTTAEEYARANPGDLLYRLNSDAIKNLDGADVSAILQKLFSDVMPRYAAPLVGEQKAILVIENLDAIKMPNDNGRSMPFMRLWQNLAASRTRTGPKFYVMLKTDSKTLATEMAPDLSLRQDLAQMLEQVPIEPPTYDMIMDHLEAKRGQIETGRVSYTQKAMELVAQIAARQSRPFEKAEQLMRLAVQHVEAEKSMDWAKIHQKRAERTRLESQKTQLQTDLRFATAPADKAELEEKIKTITARLAGMPAEAVKPLPSKTSQDLATTQVEIQGLEDQLKQLKANGFFKYAKNWFKVRKLQARLMTAGEEQRRLKKDLAGVNSGEGPHDRVSTEVINNVAKDYLGNNGRPDMRPAILTMNTIENTLVGQPHVVKAVQESLMVRHEKLYARDYAPTPEQYQLIRNGQLDDIQKPIGTFLFAGPSGVGKTAFFKKLYRHLGLTPYVIDGGTIMDRYKLSNEVGSSTGYQGGDKRGKMLKFIEENPYTALLIDEADKAHQDFWNIMLSISDDGVYHDQFGEIDFRNVLIIITSNFDREVAGWDKAKCIEFLKALPEPWSDQNIAARGQDDVYILRREVLKLKLVNTPMGQLLEKQSRMRPEMVGRMDNVIVFNYLKPEDNVKIVQNLVAQFAEDLRQLKGVEVRFTPAFFAALLDSVDELTGARSLQKVFDQLSRGQIARATMEGKLVAGDFALMDSDEKFNVTLRKASGAEVAVLDTKGTKDKLTVEEIRTDLMRAAGEDATFREARSATAELIAKSIRPELLMSERRMRGLGRVLGK